MRNGSDDGDARPGGERAVRPEGERDATPRELERSPSGRVVIRSSSHPPADATGAEGGSGVRELPDSPGWDDARRKKATPKERPRRPRRHARERARADTPAARPSGLRRRSTPPTSPPAPGLAEPSVVITPQLPPPPAPLGHPPPVAPPPARAEPPASLPEEDVPVRFRSSAPAPGRALRSQTVRLAIAIAVAILVGAWLLSSSR